MAKFLLLLALLFAAAPRVRAQDCNLSFKSQPELDDYYKRSGQVGGALCTIANSLFISGGRDDNADHIRNLDKLVALREINGDVYLDLGAITNVDGLRNITRIGGNLTISGATSLNGIGQLADSNNDLLYNLESVGGSITIRDNKSLVLVTGFLNKLRSVKFIEFTRNDNLFDIRGFGLLPRSSSIYFDNNPKLSNIQGFNNLYTIDTTPGSGSILYLGNCPQLRFIGGFSVLHDVGALIISDDPLLEEVKGFNGLRHVESLAINKNTKLRVIDGFNNALESSTLVSILDNPALQTITGFRNLKATGLAIVRNAVLREINGFDGGWVSSQLSISDNASLSTITGFRNQTRATPSLVVQRNPLLTSITGFTGTQAPTTMFLDANPALKLLSTCFLYADYSPLTRLYCQGNTSLVACAEPWLCQFLRRGGIADFSGNKAGCMQTGILAACAPVATNDLVVAGAQTITGLYRNVTVTGGGAATLSGPLVVDGTLTVQRGGVLTARQPVTGAGSFVLAAGARLVVCDTAGLSATGGEGTVQVLGRRDYSSAADYQYAGTQAQQTGASLPGLVRRLDAANPAGLRLTQPLTVTEALALSTGTVNTAGQPLTLRSDAAGTALVVAGAGTVSGPVTVQRFLSPALSPGLAYRHLAAPVGASTVAGLRTSGFVPVVNPAYNTAATPAAVVPYPTVFAYEQGRLSGPTALPFEAGWISLADTTAPLVPGQGYRVQLTAPATVDFVGMLTGGNVTQTLPRGTGPNAGWHLVGNPYPSPLDWSSLAAADRLGLDAALYVWQGTGPTTGRYRVHTNGIGASPVLALGQGFLVHASTPGQAGQLTLRDAYRLATPTPLPVLRTTADARPQLRLRLAGAGTADTTYVYFEAGATAGVTPAYDALKLTNPGNPSIATLAGDTALAINGRPPLAATTLVPVAVTVPQAGAYTLQAAGLTNFPAGTALYLRDALLGTRIPLAIGTTHAVELVGTSAPGRFVVEFSPAVVTAATPAALAAQLLVYPNPAHQRLHVQLPVGTGLVTATMLNALGQPVLTQAVLGGQAILETSGLATGVYMLRVQTAAATVAKRVTLE